MDERFGAAFDKYHEVVRDSIGKLKNPHTSLLLDLHAHAKNEYMQFGYAFSQEFLGDNSKHFVLFGFMIF